MLVFFPDTGISADHDCTIRRGFGQRAAAAREPRRLGPCQINQRAWRTWCAGERSPISQWATVPSDVLPGRGEWNTLLLRAEGLCQRGTLVCRGDFGHPYRVEAGETRTTPWAVVRRPIL